MGRHSDTRQTFVPEAHALPSSLPDIWHRTRFISCSVVIHGPMDLDWAWPMRSVWGLMSLPRDPDTALHYATEGIASRPIPESWVARVLRPVQTCCKLLRSVCGCAGPSLSPMHSKKMPLPVRRRLTVRLLGLFILLARCVIGRAFAWRLGVVFGLHVMAKLKGW